MNPGPVEEAGKAAGTFMEIMRAQPLALALVVCNILLLALFFYVAKQASENRRHEFELVLEAQKEVQKLLFQCVPATHGMRLQSIPLPIARPKEADDGNDGGSVH